MKLADLGYSAFFEAQRQRLGLDGHPVARVIAEYKEAYTVKNEAGEFPAKITGKQLFSAKCREDFPAVGDWAAVSLPGDGSAVIRAVLPRSSLLRRRGAGRFSSQVIAANLDSAFIIESLDRDFSLNRFERYCALARDGGITPSIVLNKTDLASPAELEEKTAAIRERFADMDIIPTSAAAGQGLEELRSRILPGKTYCFLGSSGVGKSSLINRLLGSDAIRTLAIGEGTGRGKHTTTRREMDFPGGGGIIIDNPGMREVGMADSGAGINNVFEEITALAENCRFKDCTHEREPGCAVQAALETGELDQGRYANYLKLKKEAAHYRLNNAGRREKDRRFGKFIKKTLDQIKKNGTP